MTKKMREMLREFDAGADVNLSWHIACLMGKRTKIAFKRTIMALLKAGMLKHSKSVGLEISEAGRAAVRGSKP